MYMSGRAICFGRGLTCKDVHKYTIKHGTGWLYLSSPDSLSLYIYMLFDRQLTTQKPKPPTAWQVLRKRRGRTLNRRIILKSYLARAADPSLPPGTPDVRQAAGETLCHVM